MQPVDVALFSPGHSSSPRLFCFDCAFLPEPHELCVVHSLHQQQRDGFGLEGGRRGGGDIVGEGKNEEGPLPVSHSTPQAGIARLVGLAYDECGKCNRLVA